MSALGNGFIGSALVTAALLAAPAMAGTYDRGASDTEIKIGNTCPYSGPNSSSGLICRAEAAYFQMLNDNGGINGRKINFISYDDAYSPPKTVEQVRKLVESDGVLLLFGNIGSATTAAIAPYVNGEGIPTLFIGAGAAHFQDPQANPYIIGYVPSYRTEAAIYGKAILADNPDAKIAILHQNDDFGKDYLAGLKAGLGDKVDQLVLVAPFETTEPTVDSHIINLQASGADTVVIVAVAKFASQSIRKIGELGWKPTVYLTNTATGVESVLKPAGLDHATGLISAVYYKQPGDPAWENDADWKDFSAFMDKYNPNEPKEYLSAFGYVSAQMMEHVLREAGDDLTRENIMKTAKSMTDARFKMLLPGVLASTSDTDYRLIEQFQRMRFNGEKWELFGDVISAAE